MKIQKTIEVSRPETVVHDIVCNMCGEKIPINQFDYYEDYLSIEKLWGYHSHYDGETHLIDICQNCYDDLLKNMKIKPQSGD